LSIIAIGIGQNVHVLIESLVHPAVPSLIDADHHWPPLMPRLMVGGEYRRHDEHRVLHSQLWAVDHGELRERVRHPELRVELERVTNYAWSISIALGVTGEIENVERYWSFSRYRGARRVPDKLVRGCPGKISNRVGGKMPDEPATRTDRRRLSRAAFGRRDNPAGGIRFEDVR